MVQPKSAHIVPTRFDAAMKQLLRNTILRFALPIAICLSCGDSFAQRKMIVNGQEVTIPEGVQITPGMIPGGMVPGGPPPNAAPSPAEDANGGEEKSKEGESKQGDAKPEGPIARPSEPPEPPDRKELDVRPDETGMVHFNFRNQSWPDVLRWLAEVSDMSLDWQELPNDYLNLATQEKQSLEHTRDLFNRHLLSRGYTLLEFDGVLQVAKTENINPSLVPKVRVSDLELLLPNQFVRVTFVLDTLVVDDIIEEFKSLMSKNGKLVSLSATNRIEAMDAAVNLQDIQRILNDEQSPAAIADLAREFVVQHIAATKAKDQIEEFMGKRRSSSPSGNINSMMMQQMQEMQQQMMAQMQQMQQGQQGGGGGRRRGNNNFYMIANDRTNSLIVHAPADQLALIESFLKRIDVPAYTSSLEGMRSRMKIYRLDSMDPETLVKNLLNMDILEPKTKLEADKKNKSLIAYASMADQLAISELIERLDGSPRNFEVVKLRRLRAEEVAGTIEFLMGVNKKEEDSNSRRNYYYFDPWSNNKEDDSQDRNEFRVAANTKDNQLLVWCNENELKEINNLLVKLGEIPSAESRNSKYRVIDASKSPETYKYLLKLQERFNQVAPNPLILPDASNFRTIDAPAEMPDEDVAAPSTNTSESTGEDSSAPSPSYDLESTDSENAGESTSNSDAPPVSIDKKAIGFQQNPSTKPARLLTAIGLSGDDSIDSEPKNADDNESGTGADSDVTGRGNLDRGTRMQPAPIQISVDERGNLILYSEDRQALEMLENLMLDMAPPKKDYYVFSVEHARASWIKLNLEDYFKDETKKKNDNFYRWVFDLPPEDDKKQDLSSEIKLRFIADNDTNTIIVTGSDEVTRATIRELIELWDVPEETDDSDVRFTRLVKIKYSQAPSIVEAIKDAYRDLLSSNDRAFQEQNQGGGGGGRGGSTEAKRESRSSVSNGGLNFSFSGRLSLGVDRLTNSIIVSAEGQPLLDLICEMIEELDQAARPNGATQIVQIGEGMGSKAMEKALRAIMKQQETAPNQQNQQAAQNAENGQVEFQQ